MSFGKRKNFDLQMTAQEFTVQQAYDGAKTSPVKLAWREVMEWTGPHAIATCEIREQVAKILRREYEAA